MSKTAIRDLAKRLGGGRLDNFVGRKDIDLEKAWDFLQRMDVILPPGTYRFQFFKEIDEKTLQNWLNNPPVNNNLLETLYKHRWLPSPKILNALQQGENLEDITTLMHGGYFDSKNELHLELEYSLSSVDPDTFFMRRYSFSFEEFRRIPTLPVHGVCLNTRDNEHIDTCAREAAEVFKVIRERQDEETRPLLVIGNKRYGKNFVIEPLEERLRRLGCQIVYEYVRSTDLDYDEHREAELSVDTQTRIATEKPPLVVVDGTSQPKEYDDQRIKLTRFPAAMKGYMNYLQNIVPRGYDFSFWAPQINPYRFYLNHKIYRPKPARRKLKALFISSTTIEEEGGSNGFFDDAEFHINGNRPVFTTTGVDLRKMAPSEKDFVAVVQEKMKEKISEYLDR